VNSLQTLGFKEKYGNPLPGFFYFMPSSLGARKARKLQTVGIDCLNVQKKALHLVVFS
jgi:hypothetical protein